MQRVNPPHDPGRRGAIKRGAQLMTGGLGALHLAGCGDSEPVAPTTEQNQTSYSRPDFFNHKLLKPELDNVRFTSEEKQLALKNLNYIYDIFHNSMEHVGYLDGRTKTQDEFLGIVTVFGQLLGKMDLPKHNGNNEAVLLMDALTGKAVFDCDTTARLIKMICESTPKLGIRKLDLATSPTEDLVELPNRDHMVLRYGKPHLVNINCGYYDNSQKTTEALARPLPDPFYYQRAKLVGFSEEDINNFGFMRNLSDDEIQAEILCSIAIDHESKGEREKSLACLKQACELAPKLLYLQELYLEDAFNLGIDVEAEATKLADQKFIPAIEPLVKGAANKGDFDKVFAIFDKYIKKFPKLFSLYNRRASWHFEAGNIPSALKDQDKSFAVLGSTDQTKIKEAKIGSLLDHAEGFIQRSKNEFAQRCIDACLEIDPQNKQALKLQKQVQANSKRNPK